MESQNNLETIGSLRINPLAELLVEIAQNKLNGSLRMTNAAEKIAVYFDAGETVFAVSNAKRHRLFERLLEAEKITKDQLVVVPEFTNDLVLKEFLLKNDMLEKEEISRLFPEQISDILRTALSWREGEWTFSPLVRIKGDIRFSVEAPDLLAEYARGLPAQEAARKFNNPQESFAVRPVMPSNINLSPAESFVFSRFEASSLTVDEIQNLSGLPETETFQILYVLWLSGLIVRENWSAAFTERKISAILSARLSLKKEEQAAPLPIIRPQGTKTETSAEETKEIDRENIEDNADGEKQISLEDYLNRLEKATTFYQFFAVAPSAKVSEIKQSYFGLAKRFHPDLFHKETDAKLLQRIQTAFTKLAQAYDTLKTESAREVYDFKMRKELAETKSSVGEMEATQKTVESQKQFDQAAENFEQGYNLLMKEDYEKALPFLARAVHSDRNNARYHAFYGKLLSQDDKHRHKAESELQTAVRLDHQSAEYRIMLAEFFIQFNLLKRAEGELNRLLTIHPNNRQAHRLLDSLLKK